MNKYYSTNPTFYVGIDCIIFGFSEGEISLLLLKRNFEPAMGEWSLMGGFVQKDESVDDAAKRVLHELTGLENVYMEQVGAFGAVERDPGERVNVISQHPAIAEKLQRIADQCREDLGDDLTGQPGKNRREPGRID